MLWNDIGGRALERGALQRADAAGAVGLRSSNEGLFLEDRLELRVEEGSRSLPRRVGGSEAEHTRGAP